MNHIVQQISPREEAVLKAVVEDYITESSPIGSNVLKDKHAFDCSPATLRNIMARLEKKNLLMHTHTSSGRVPTDMGYRYYVDHLLTQQKNALQDYNVIEEELQQTSTNIDDLLQTTAAMLSKISHLFGVAMVISYEKSILKEIELVPLSSDRVMVVLGMKSGLVRSIVLNLHMAIAEDEIQKVTVLLKEKLLGLTLQEIKNTIVERMHDAPMSDHEIVQILLHNYKEHFNIPNDQLVYTSSHSELLGLPENQELDSLQQTMVAIDNSNITDYFRTYLNQQNNYLLIGKENKEELYNNCTIVTNVFNGNTFQGQIGIVGPTRIPYGRVIRILNNFREIINRVS